MANKNDSGNAESARLRNVAKCARPIFRGQQPFLWSGAGNETMLVDAQKNSAGKRTKFVHRAVLVQVSGGGGCS